MAEREYILGIDYGEKRIGIAIAHDIARLPRPLTTIENTTTALQDIAAIVEREHVKRVVLGLPRSMDGSIHAQAKLVEDFCQQLQGVLSVPIVFVDETLSSVQAEQQLAKQSRQQRIAKGDIDAVAAALILERYFEEAGTGQV